jgi:6-phosphogluconate dehydrogenase (decarboxylating)
MRANLVRRLIRDGYRCVADDRNPEVVKSLEVDGANGADSYEEFGREQHRPRNDGAVPDGCLHCDPAGAGHFVKMVPIALETVGGFTG